MADRMLKVKTRRLRQVADTARGHAGKTTAQDNAQRQPTRVGKAFSALKRLGRLPVWKPFLFIARFLIPPYIRNSGRELAMVDWPDRRQTRQLTGAVILFTIVFGTLVAILDFGLDKLFKQVIVK